jgi:hypothetical protein
MKKTVYNYISEWGNGNKFEGSVTAKAYGSKEEAQEYLKADYEQARTSFENVGYDDDETNVEIDDDNMRIMLDANEFDDWWEGTILEQEVTFNN